jgi:hypothetical protein
MSEMNWRKGKLIIFAQFFSLEIDGQKDRRSQAY